MKESDGIRKDQIGPPSMATHDGSLELLVGTLKLNSVLKVDENFTLRINIY